MFSYYIDFPLTVTAEIFSPAQKKKKEGSKSTYFYNLMNIFHIESFNKWKRTVYNI